MSVADALADYIRSSLGLPEDLKLDYRGYGVWRVKTTATHHLEVCQQIFNWRLVTTPIDNPNEWDRGWCYFGAGAFTFATAVIAALTWDGSDDSEPSGWNKNLQTGEIRRP